MLHLETVIDLFQRHHDRRRASARRRRGISFSWSLETDIRLEDRTLLSVAADHKPLFVALPASPPGERSMPDPSPVNIPLSSSTWTAQGPAPITNGQTPGNQPVSGRIAAVAADPTDPNTLYIAAAGGGVWKTTNATSLTPTWTPLTDSQATLSMGAIAVAPSNSQVIYAGTGEAHFSADSNYGRGILVSSDGGSTWTLTGTSSFDRRAISKIAVDPFNPDVAYAAVARAGINGVSGWGIYKTTNRGTSWTNDSPTGTTGDSFTDVAIDPTDPNANTVYAAAGEIFGNARQRPLQVNQRRRLLDPADPALRDPRRADLDRGRPVEPVDHLRVDRRQPRNHGLRPVQVRAVRQRGHNLDHPDPAELHGYPRLVRPDPDRQPDELVRRFCRWRGGFHR